MRGSRWLPAGLALLVAASAVGYALIEYAHRQPTLGVRHAYLLVSVEASPGWIERHRPTIVWGDQEVQLPVVFRCRVAGSRGPDWGALAEYQQGLTIQGVEVPVRVTPPVNCRVSNEPTVGLIPERGGPREAALSVATWVSVGPPDRSSVSPAQAAGQVLTSGADVVRRVEELIAARQVIDVGPAP